MKHYSRRYQCWVWVYQSASTRWWYAKPFYELGPAICGPYSRYPDIWKALDEEAKA